MKKIYSKLKYLVRISRLTRSKFSFVAAVFACVLGVSQARAVVPTDFAKKMTLTPSETALAKIGETAWTDFPVLVRLPAEASALLQSANGTDLLFTDENDATLPFEVETFDPAGTTFVWVKVPSLSSKTRLTVYFGGSANVDNDPTAVWSRYVGVWHYAPSDAGGTTVADATGHGLTGSTTGTLSTYAGPFGGDAIHSTATVTAPNYDALVPNAGQFTASGWFKAPSQAGNYLTFVSKKTGLSWNDAKGWYLEMGQSKTKMNLVLGDSVTSATIRDVSANWNHFSIVSDGTNVRVYMNGSASAAITKAYAVKASGRDFVISPNKADNCTDEYRLRAGAASAAETALEYATMADTAFFDASTIESVDATAQVFETPTVVRNGNGSYTVSVELLENSGDVGVIYEGGETVVTNILATAANPGTYTDTPANLTADKTYKFTAYGKNAKSTEVVAKGGVFYNGDLSIEKISDANENGLIPGVFRISRADTAHDLTVAYTIGGTAAAGQTYAALSGTATIPAGSTSVDVEIVPLIDAQTTSDTTVTVTLVAGLYSIDAQAGSAELTVVNLVAPAGYNTWVATSNGLASEGSNWSKGVAPAASDNILFDGRFSTANCEWDAAATATVASWTQNADYTGTVTFDTEFPDYSGATFTFFTVTGNCDLQGGSWSCRGNYNNFGVVVSMMQTTKTDKHWCLNVSVGESMTVGSGAAITVTGRGYGYQTPNPNYSQSYGGYAFGGANSPYGSITEPFDPGRGCISQTDGNNKSKISGIGGGAVKLAVAGNLTVNGRIEAVGTMDQNISRSGGTGGSIWIVANQISGSGTIDASACPKSFYTSDQGVSIGSGGRIALYTQSPLAFPMANVLCSGTSYAGTGSSSKTMISGPGTIFVKDPTQTQGTLYVKQSSTVANTGNKWTGTPVMGDLSLDAVVLSGNAQLRIPAGTSLTLPSISAVTTDNTSAGIAGIVCGGGTLNIGNGDQVLKSNVAFASPTPFAFPADLTLESGAHLGRVGGAFGQNLSHFDTNFTVSVAGDLTIPSDATAGASGCCAFTATDNAQLGAHGGQSLWASIGGYGTNAFDSVLNPSMPGGSRYRGFRAGGVFRLTVGGELVLNGVISSDGSGARGNGDTADKHAAAAAGTLNFSLGSLSGTGSITAQGGCGKYNYAGGAGGGRVAVRLTGNDSTFSDYWKTNITAYGVSFSAGKNEKASSAGTVYLQDASDGEAAGMVLIRNDLALEAGAVNNKAVTLYPGKGVGCDAPEAFKKTDLVVAGAAKVQLTDALKIAGLTIDSDSLIDLNGKKLTVNTAKVNGVKLAPGTYAAGDEALEGFIIDSASGGALVVTGGGFVLHVR